jgi:glycosyltransferase involved in cell wall biosynthesis
MRILLISQYFWPENFRVNDFCVGLTELGYSVTVLTGKPNYPKGKYYPGYNFFNKRQQEYKGIKILRAWLVPRGKGNGLNLILNYLSFMIFSSLRILFLKGNFDKIIVYQLSPATVGVPAVIAKKKFNAKMYFYIQDLWPESLMDAGDIKNRKILNLVDKMMKMIYRNSHQIWVQSEGFTEYLCKRGIEKDKIFYVPNTVEEFYYPRIKIDNIKNRFPSGFNILFAGNIGVAQDFDTVIASALILYKKGLNINWIILGEGRDLSRVKNIIADLEIKDKFLFFGSLPSYEMPNYFACADALLVSLKKSLIFSLTIPSKVQSYMACGKLIIGNIEGTSAGIIANSGSGLCSQSGNHYELARNIEYLYYQNQESINKYNLNSYNYFKDNFERKKIFMDIAKYLNA